MEKSRCWGCIKIRKSAKMSCLFRKHVPSTVPLLSQKNAILAKYTVSLAGKRGHYLVTGIVYEKQIEMGQKR